MKRTNKKGFTIVELVIVIAVIAILAAVLIPNISRLVKKAQVSSDLSLVRNLNTALASEDATLNYPTAFDAFDAVKKCGFDVTLIEAKADKNHILYDSVNKCFVYDNNGKLEYYPNTASKTLSDSESYKLWKVYTKASDIDNRYSIFWNGEDEPISLTGVGFDAGYKTVSKVDYTGAAAAHTVTIRTTSGELTVNAPADTVSHYGVADYVIITAVDTASYYEYGTVQEIKIAKGHIAIKDEAKIGSVIITADTIAKGTDGQYNVSVEVAEKATVGAVGASTSDIVEKLVDVVSGIQPLDKVADNKGFEGGLGIEAAPYLISTPEQMLLVETNEEKKNVFYKLMADVVVNEEIYLGGQSVVIDLNGHSIELVYHDDSQKNNYATLSTGGSGSKLVILDSSEEQSGAVYGPDLTIDNKAPCAVRTNNKATLEIRGGHYYGRGLGNPCIFNYGRNATIKIYGGVFETKSDAYGKYFVLNHQDGNKWNNMSTSKMEVYGGVFIDYNPGVTEVESPSNSYAGKIIVANGYKTETKTTIDGKTQYIVVKA